ncbi:hypothetical protein MPDQ_001830 [Monascus purpureus]|uniref:Uncharacterized protein n=1 Tax=Monascus purpureus TaxID=5098 RepID=A0A507QR33_MONPU|nr:hypothetical protein MPDQ_001830 [Monascus purpureus]
MQTITTPSPSSLLWAHEIRRENIHLLNQLDATRTSLSSTTQTTQTLKQSVAELTQLVRELGAENRVLHDTLDDVQRKLALLGDRVESTSTSTVTSLESLGRRVGGLEDEIGVSRGRISAFERQLRGAVSGDEVREMVGRELRASRVCFGTARKDDENPDVLVPDSVPFTNTNTSTATVENPGSIQDRNISVLDSIEGITRETRESQYQDCDTTKDEKGEHGPKEQVEMASVRGGNSYNFEIENLKQRERTLSEYLSFAVEVRRQLPPRKREGVIVEAFVGGLDNLYTRELLEKQMDRDGWSWGVLETVLNNIISEQGGRDVQAISDGIGSNARGETTDSKGSTGCRPDGHGMANDTNLKQRHRKKRRCIPIVPVDEDDLLP